MTNIPIVDPPPAPSAGNVVLYGEETISGVRLMAKFPNGDTTEVASEGSEPGQDSMLIWLSDMHIGSPGGTQARVTALVTHLLGLSPDGVIDTGDCKHNYGTTTGGELDNYKTWVRSTLPWLVSTGAPYPILPGNHDEVYDYASPVGMPTDWSLWDPRMWSAPYRWRADWSQAHIRFLAIHSYIKHENPLLGFFSVDQADIDWLEDELAVLPSGWKAIVCSHAPADPVFGNYIHDSLGGANLRTLLAVNAGKIAAYLNGHRHGNMENAALNGIRHMNGPSTSYTQGNGYGAYTRIEYTAATNSIKFRVFYAANGFTEYPTSLYTPVTINL